MKLQFNRDMWSLRYHIIFMAVLLALVTPVLSKDNMLVLAFPMILLISLFITDEKNNLMSFVYALPVRRSSYVAGRSSAVLAIGAGFVFLEVIVRAAVTAIPATELLLLSVIKVSTVLILVPGVLVFFTFIEGKVLRWVPTVLLYFMMSFISIFLFETGTFMMEYYETRAFFAIAAVFLGSAVISVAVHALANYFFLRKDIT